MSEQLYEYLDPVSPSLECPICRSPLVDPIMPQRCQHLFCRLCLERAMEISQTCPIDREKIKKSDLVGAPRVVLELLGELRVRCNGCEVELTREDYGRHEAECEARKKRNEDVEGEAGQLEEGGSLQRVSEEDDVVCSDCNELVESTKLESHTQDCSALPHPCRYCSLSLPPKSLASHLLNSCPVVQTPCPHALFGCPHIGPRSTLASDHLDTECPYEPLKECFERFQEKEREWEGENWTLREKVKGLEERLEDVEHSLKGTRYSIGDYLVPEASTTTDEPTAQPPLTSTIASLTSRNASLSSSLACLTQSHTDSLHTTQHLVEELNTMRSVIGGMRMQMGDLMRTVQIMSSCLPNETRRSDSDSSNPDQDQLNLELQDMLEPYLSSSSDPEEESSLLYPHPSQRFSGPYSRPSLPPLAQRYSYPQHHPSQAWPNGMNQVRPGEGGPSLFDYQGISRPPPFYPLAGGPGVSRRNGRVVGGIGGGMKL
ncbi:hypothetical protein JCM5353_001319 [Sporobolomyces roseus]